MSSQGLTIIIPTYGRDEILVETLRHAVNPPASEIIVIDQTEEHSSHGSCALHSWQAWLRSLPSPVLLPTTPRRKRT